MSLDLKLNKKQMNSINSCCFFRPSVGVFQGLFGFVLCLHCGKSQFNNAHKVNLYLSNCHFPTSHNVHFSIYPLWQDFKHSI